MDAGVVLGSVLMALFAFLCNITKVSLSVCACDTVRGAVGPVFRMHHAGLPVLSGVHPTKNCLTFVVGEFWGELVEKTLRNAGREVHVFWVLWMFPGVSGVFFSLCSVCG